MLLHFFRSAALAVVGAAIAAGALAAPPAPSLPDGSDQLVVKYRDQIGVVRGGADSTILGHRLQALQGRAARHGVVLRFKRNSALGSHVIKLDHELGAAQMQALVADLKSADPDIEYVESDRARAAPQSAIEIDDPLLYTGNWLGQRQWNLTDYTAGIRAPEAWDEAWQGWVREGEKLFVNGFRLVRYGQYYYPWAYKEVSGTVDCNVATFGSDPAPNVQKRCEVASYWTRAAREGEPLDFSSAQWLRYGWGDNWIYARKQAATCNVANFGYDPAPGVHKICQVQSRTDGGGVVATESGSFILSAPASVRYGASGKWIYKHLSSGVSYDCNPQQFQGDPYPNVSKRCEVVKSMGDGVVIAVLDRGHVPHPDLDDNVVGGYRFLHGGHSTDYLDKGGAACGKLADWHGLRVASVAAAVANNGSDMAGVAPQAKILHVKVIDPCENNYSSDAADAIAWAAGGAFGGGVVPDNAHPARVINAAIFGSGTPCPSDVQRAINYARSRQAVVVAGAGNDGVDTDQPGASGFPMNCAGVIAVGATNSSGQLGTSNYGSPIALSAPGGDWAYGVWSLGNTGWSGVGAPTTIRGDGMTSLATATVSGVAAQMLGKNPSLSGVNVEHRLKLSARPFPAQCNKCGAGIVDADRALRSAEAIRQETEPNDASIGNYIAAPADVTGTMGSIGDEDNFHLDLPANSTVAAILVPPAAGEYPLALKQLDGSTIARSALGPGAQQNVSWVNNTGTTQRLVLNVSRTSGPTGSAGAYTLLVKW